MTYMISNSGRNSCLDLLRSFASDRQGATAIEYALVAAGIFLAIVTAVPQVGDGVTGLLTEVKDSF
jgi:pilus assembly protein Flp/PilA